MSITTTEVQQTVTVVSEIKCDNCKSVITFVFANVLQNCVQGHNMLHVTLSGGYGEFIDGARDVHLCEICAKILIQSFPLFQTVVDNTNIGSDNWRITSTIEE